MPTFINEDTGDSFVSLDFEKIIKPHVYPGTEITIREDDGKVFYTVSKPKFFDMDPNECKSYREKFGLEIEKFTLGLKRKVLDVYSGYTCGSIPYSWVSLDYIKKNNYESIIVVPTEKDFKEFVDSGFKPLQGIPTKVEMFGGSVPVLLEDPKHWRLLDPLYDLDTPEKIKQFKEEENEALKERAQVMPCFSETR